MRKEFHLSDGDIGLLGSAFIWIYAVIGVPFGRFADKRSRKGLLGVGILIWSALTAFAGVASSYAMLMFSRIGVGVGEAVVAPSGTSWIGDLVPPEKRSKALALFMLGVPIGGALSYFFSGPIAQAFGWRVGMMAAAAPALVLIPVLLFLKEPDRGAAEAKPEVVEGSVWSVLKIPTLWWIIASGALLNFNMYAYGTFLPAFLSRIHGLTLARSGIATGVVFAVGGISGGLLAGRLGDRVIHKRENGRLLFAAILTGLGAPAALLGVGAGSVYLAIVLITFSYGTLNTYYGFVYSAIQDIVAPAMRGTAMAVYFLAMYLCGASFGPLLTGKLSDLMARRAAGGARVTEAFKAIGLQQAMYVI